MGNNIIFASGPVFTRITCEIYFFEVGKFGEADDALMNISDIDEVDSHI